MKVFGPVETLAEADLILASASPRRQQLLGNMRARFIVIPAHIDETPARDECPKEYVLRMARGKAETVYRSSAVRGQHHLPVLGVDTAVIAPQKISSSGVVKEQIFGKPESEHHGLAMLQTLSGVTHRVLSALALVGESEKNKGKSAEEFWCESKVVETEVTFRVLSESECRAYWRSGEPVGKAGSYAIQGLGGLFVTRIAGSYSSVVGLPVEETYTLLQTFNIPCGLDGL